MIFRLMSKVMLCLEEEREEIKEDGNWCTSSCILGRGARPKSNGERKQKTQNLQKARQPNTKREKMQKQERQSQKIFWPWSRKNSIAKSAPSLQQKLSTDCLNIWIRRKMLILSLNLFLVLIPKSFTGACSSSLNCFTIAQWTKSLCWYSRRVDYEI